MRRSTKLIVGVMAVLVVLIPVAVLAFFAEGSWDSSSPPRVNVMNHTGLHTGLVSVPRWVKASEPWVMREFHVNAERHAKSCTRKGPKTVCLFAGDSLTFRRTDIRPAAVIGGGVAGLRSTDVRPAAVIVTLR